ERNHRRPGPVAPAPRPGSGHATRPATTHTHPEQAVSAQVAGTGHGPAHPKTLPRGTLMLTLTTTATPPTPTHSNPPGALVVLILLALAWTAGYLLLCWIRPLRHCRRCAGLGKRRTPTGRKLRPCRRCDATGYRTGRHLLNALRSTRNLTGRW